MRTLPVVRPRRLLAPLLAMAAADGVVGCSGPARPGVGHAPWTSASEDGVAGHAFPSRLW